MVGTQTKETFVSINKERGILICRLELKKTHRSLASVAVVVAQQVSVVDGMR